MPEGLTGQPLRRREDARFLTGAGRYTADIEVSGALHLHVLRSPHAHARVLGIEADAARAMPGVRERLLAALDPVLLRQRERIGEGQRRCFEADVVLAPIRGRLVRVPLEANGHTELLLQIPPWGPHGFGHQ